MLLGILVLVALLRLELFRVYPPLKLPLCWLGLLAASMQRQLFRIWLKRMLFAQEQWLDERAEMGSFLVMGSFLFRQAAVDYAAGAFNSSSGQYL